MTAEADDLLSGLGAMVAGQRLGRYELLAPIGRGGMAVVWIARRDDGTAVAVKTMLPALSADPRFEAMFLAEARLAASLEHPGIARVLDYGETAGRLWIAMELVEGTSLAAIQAASPAPLSPWVVARIALDVARGLHAAHESRADDGASLAIVHRDVSPQNILVAVTGDAKIADFGVARFHGGPATQAGFVKGKIRYMAPEQVYCEEVDRRTDGFALGVVLYEATTGIHPFGGATETAILARLADAEPAAPIRSHLDDFPPDLALVIDRALAKEPEARYATLAELADALEHALSERPVDVGSLDVGSVVRERASTELGRVERALAMPRAAPRSRRVAVVAALALAALVGGLAIRARGSHPADPGRAPPLAASADESPVTNVPAPRPSPVPSGETAFVDVQPRTSTRRAPTPQGPIAPTTTSDAEPTPAPSGSWKPGILDTSD